MLSGREADRITALIEEVIDGQRDSISLIAIERALETRCICMALENNRTCKTHVVYGMVRAALDPAAVERVVAGLHGYLDFGALEDALREKGADELRQSDEVVSTEKHEEEIAEKNEELQERDENITSLRAHVAALEQALIAARPGTGADAAAEIRKGPQGEGLAAFKEREANAQKQWAHETRVEIEKQFDSKLKAERERADEAVRKLRASKTYKKYAERQIPAPVPLTLEEIKAEIAAAGVEVQWESDGSAQGAIRIVHRKQYAEPHYAVMEWRQPDLTLTDMTRLEFQLRLARLSAANLRFQLADAHAAVKEANEHVAVMEKEAATAKAVAAAEPEAKPKMGLNIPPQDCPKCGARCTFDADAVGYTSGGLQLRGWDRCDACKQFWVTRAGVPAEDIGWRRSAHSIDAGGFRIRLEGKTGATHKALLDRLEKLPVLEAEVATLRKGLDAARMRTTGEVIAAPTAPAPCFKLSAATVQELAQALAMQPSGLQAMIDVAKAQQPKAFGRKK
jgi:hypothetical protein